MREFKHVPTYVCPCVCVCACVLLLWVPAWYYCVTVCRNMKPGREKEGGERRRETDRQTEEAMARMYIIREAFPLLL